MEKDYIKEIKNYFQKLNPQIIIQAPSRINLINPLDAVEGDFWMPAVAIEGKSNPLSVFIYIKEISEGNKLKVFDFNSTKNGSSIIKLKEEKRLTKKIDIIKKQLYDEFKLIYACFYRIFLSNSSLWRRIESCNLEIGILSTIPRQSGLGGSSSIIIALVYGLAKYFDFINKINNLNRNELPINKDILAEICTKVEDEDLKITAGYSDRYVISRGGLSFCSYYGKLYHKKITQEPLAVYDRMDQTYNIDKLPIIVCFSGSIHESGDVHKKLRKMYLNKNTKILEKYLQLAKIAWKSRFSLMKKDWEQLGTYFRENTNIMNEIMQIADFKYGIGLANNILITLIEENEEVYAAKLTGAGGGGSVFALVNPNKIEDVLTYWKKSLNDLIKDPQKFKDKFPHYPMKIRKDLKNAQFFQIKINKSGVKSI
jgi:galactokinase/mevalonate kinase-like predicted kinase